MKHLKIFFYALTLVILPGCYNEWEDNYYNDFSFKSDIQSTPFQRVRNMSENSKPDCLIWAILNTQCPKINNPTYDNIAYYAGTIKPNWDDETPDNNSLGFTFNEADQIITHFVNATSHTSLPDSLLGHNLGKYIMIYNTGTLDHAVNATRYYLENGVNKVNYIDYSTRHDFGRYGSISASNIERIYY